MSQTRIDASGIRNLLNSSQSLEPKAVGFQFLIMTTLSLLTIIIFSVLRTGNEAVYEPKNKYHAHDKRPPVISRSCCGWIYTIRHIHEERLYNLIGLDAFAFLRFLRLMRWLLSVVAVCSCGVLIPLDFIYTLSFKPSGYDILSAMTIRDIQGNRLYAHIGIEYLATVILLSLVYHHWRRIYRLRSRWLRSFEYQNALHARALYISNISKKRQTIAGLYGIFKGMNLPYPVTSVHIGTGVGDLPKLIEKHNNLVEEFEEVLLQANPLQDGYFEQPVITRGGYCGIGGRKQDAVSYYLENLKCSAAMIQQYRAQIEMRQSENYGFATISTIPLAHAAAQELKGMHPKGLTFKLAPNPRDIIWQNMGLSSTQRRFRRTSGFLLLYFFCFLSLVPLFPIASLANLNAIATSGYVPFLQKWIKSSPLTFTLVSGLVPPAVAALFGGFIPVIMRWLSRYMGATTHSGLDRIVIARYFGFLFISQLVFFTIIGVIFNSVLEIIISIQNEGANLKLVLNNLDKLPGKLAVTYVDQSPFWLKWFALKGLSVMLDLARLTEVVRIYFRSSISQYTPRKFQQISKPLIFNYGVQYSDLLFTGLIGLLFAPIAPLVTLVAAVIFWLCSWVYEYQLLYKYMTRVETGARAWNVVINRLLFCCVFMQAVMIITIGFQANFRSLKFLVAIPPILLTMLSKYYLNKWFANDFEFYVPDSTEHLSRCIGPSEQSDAIENKLEKRYEHPALHSRIFSPMVHAQIMPVLSRELEDRNRSRSMTNRNTSASKTTVYRLGNGEETLEGTGIIPVNESELAYDPIRYKHDREVDCDFDSVKKEAPASDSYQHKSAFDLAQDNARRLYDISSFRKPGRRSSRRTHRTIEPDNRVHVVRGAPENSIHQIEEVTGPSQTSQLVRHGGNQHNAYADTFNPRSTHRQSSQNTRKQNIPASGSGRHNQVAPPSEQRTTSGSRERTRKYSPLRKQNDKPFSRILPDP